MTIAEQLERRVGKVVRRVISELPQDLRGLAERVPVFCEWEMADHWLEEGVAEDSLGLFSGPALDEPSDPGCLESPRITFFLAELWDYCEEDLAAFDEEVRITYLHEFGHYLGLDEAELDARGLL
ncbi:MAG: metallopeptidase family protein [Kiritimatiellia bacterium]